MHSEIDSKYREILQNRIDDEEWRVA